MLVSSLIYCAPAPPVREPINSKIYDWSSHYFDYELTFDVDFRCQSVRVGDIIDIDNDPWVGCQFRINMMGENGFDADGNLPNLKAMEDLIIHLEEKSKELNKPLMYR